MSIHCATCIILLLLNFSLPAAEPVLLKPHWEPGKVYTQETTTEMNFKVPALLDATDQKTNITQILTVTVAKDGESDRKVAEVRVLSLKGTMDLMGQTLNYDSASPAQSPPFLQQAFGTLAGKSFSLIYDQGDSYVETRTTDPHAPTTPLGSGKNITSQQLSDAFRKSQEIPLPKKAVTVGDTWRYQDKLEMPPVGVIKIEVSGKFDSVVEENGHRQAKLVIEGAFQFPQNEGSIITIAPGSKFTGDLFFDLDRKVVTRSTTISTINVLIEGKEAPLSQILKTKLISIEDAPR
ncbi:hypothetical protein BH11VER1_BH11VER1_00670 [soil metagenome]